MYFESGADILDAAMDALGLGRVGSLSSAYGAPKESDARTLFAYVKNQEYAHRWSKGSRESISGGNDMQSNIGLRRTDLPPS